jgi:hypothetical protein
MAYIITDIYALFFKAFTNMLEVVDFPTPAGPDKI